jgi:hypothetical protein
MDNFSRSLKVPLLVVAADFPLSSVAATGRRTGSSTNPDKTKIPNTADELGKREYKKFFCVSPKS